LLNNGLLAFHEERAIGVPSKMILFLLDEPSFWCKDKVALQSLTRRAAEHCLLLHETERLLPQPHPVRPHKKHSE